MRYAMLLKPHPNVDVYKRQLRLRAGNRHDDALRYGRGAAEQQEHPGSLSGQGKKGKTCLKKAPFERQRPLGRRTFYAGSGFGFRSMASCKARQKDVYKRQGNAYAGLMLAVTLYAMGGGLIEVLVSPIVEALSLIHISSKIRLVSSYGCFYMG